MSTGDREHYKNSVTNGSIRIGIAQDAAFGFYYQDDLEALTASGAKLVTFDALHDRELPSVDGLFIGGGFPEVHMEDLQGARGLGDRGGTLFQPGIDVGEPTFRGWWSVPFASYEN